MVRRHHAKSFALDTWREANLCCPFSRLERPKSDLFQSPVLYSGPWNRGF